MYDFMYVLIRSFRDVLSLKIYFRYFKIILDVVFLIIFRMIGEIFVLLDV